MKLIWLALVLGLPLSVMAASFPADESVPGGVAVLPLPLQGKAAPRVELDGHRIMVVQNAGQWYALAGIPLETTPGLKNLSIQEKGLAPAALTFAVAAKTYGTQSLSIANPEMVNPTPAQQRRILREQEHLDKVLNGWRKTAHPGIVFIWPAKGPETSGFGLKRVLNGEAKSPHSGIDIGGTTGTPIMAPADAVVADVGNYYFCGKTLTLDMGQGLYSVYCHLSRIKVRPGERVRQGELVGKMGATGRTTGPNLHWTVRLNGAAVDPHVFLGANALPPPPAAPAVTAPLPAAATKPVPAAGTHGE